MEALDNPSYFSLPGGSTSGIPASTSRGPFCLLKRRGTSTSHKMGANTSSVSVSSTTCTSSSLIHSGNRNSCSAPTTPTTPEAASIPLLPSPSPPAPVPLSSHSHHRRSFRSLLRSMSATSHNHYYHHGSHGSTVYELQHQLLVLGEPRPCDMAPVSPYLPHHQHHSSTSSSPDKEERHNKHRRNHSNKNIKSPKSSTELLNSDLVYCPVSDPRTPTLLSPSKSSLSDNKNIKSPKSSMELLNNDMVYCPVSEPRTPTSLPIPKSATLDNKSTKSPKSSTELSNNDMIYYPVLDPGTSTTLSVPKSAASEELLGGSPEEVFFANGDARYYNLTAAMTIPLPGSNSSTSRRRHSIGTYLNKDRGSCGSLPKTPSSTPVHTPDVESKTVLSASNKDKVQKSSTSVGSKGLQPNTKTGLMQEATSPVGAGGCSPDWRHPKSSQMVTEVPRSTHSRRRCNRCSNIKGNRVADMDDILIVSSNQSQAATLWVNYLKICFEQINKSRRKPPFKIMCVGLEDIVNSQVVSLATEEKMMRVKLQIVIICPQFLHHIYENPGPATTLGRILQPDRVLAMLLGVDESSVTEQHRAALISYQQWHHLPVKDQDESFVSKFLQEALDIMARVWRQQTLRADKALFSVIPKKVKKGQNKVIILLNEPTEEEDKLKVTVDKNGERLEISSVKRRNPYTLHFQMPDACLEVSMLVSVHIEKNGQALGYRQVKCESRMRELDQILRSCDSPLEFMCQTLGFSPGDREHLDNFLVLAFQRNLPPHFSLLHAPRHPHHRTHTSPEEYPTLLHFAARHGLEKFAWQLLECPGGEYACEIRNACELTPAEMAEAAGQHKLANALRGYMQMTEFTSMYSYMKIMSEGSTKFTGFNEVEYHQPRPLCETYQVPPSARGLMDNYQVPPAARPYLPSENEMGYMEMHPSAPLVKSPSIAFKSSMDFLSSATTSSATSTTTIQSSSPVHTTPKSDSLDQQSIEEEKHSISGSIKRSCEQINQPYGAQEELVEILNDFKNNVFTIAEVETFVEGWRNRNDVQQSFKDKQEQLNQMREEYERLQQQMKENMKRPTPFERIRNFFKGKSKESKEPSTGPSADGTKTPGTESIPVCQRPSSSLSLHSISSSSSSGRMSTASACSGASMGDSGTHSDADDRKMVSLPFEANKCGSGVKCGIQSYEIPPAPRPLNRKYSPPRYTPAPMRQQPTRTPSPSASVITIENRPPWPSPRPDLMEYDEGNTSDSNINDLNVTKPAMILKSPTSKRRAYKNRKVNGVDEQKTQTVDEDCEYLEVQGSPEDENTNKLDYVNIPGIETSRTSTTDMTLNTNSDESASQIETSNEINRIDTFDPAASDDLDLPDYVNVQVPSSEPCLPPPVPPRNK